MDRFAIRLMETLSQDTTDDDGKVDAGMVKTQMDAFRMAQDWLVKRKRLRPGKDAGGEGLDLLRESMNDPRKFTEYLKEQGFVMMPKRTAKGRPKKAESEEIKKAKMAIAEHKQPGSGWSKEFGLLGG